MKRMLALLIASSCACTVSSPGPNPATTPVLPDCAPDSLVHRSSAGAWDCIPLSSLAQADGGPINAVTLQGYPASTFLFGDAGALFADYAPDAGSALHSETADYALDAGYAVNAGYASYALTSGSAGSASSASFALQADYARDAGYALNAGAALYSTSAGSALHAAVSDYSADAGSALTAATATYATSAGSAASASNASHSLAADYAADAGTALNAINASYATQAGSASSASSVPASGVQAGALGSSVIASAVGAGVVQDSSIVSVAGSKITGAISGTLSASNVTSGTLPAGVNVPVANIVGSISGTTPIGSIVLFAGSTEPVGWIETDGRSLSQSGTATASWGSYNTQALFSAIGTSWGSASSGVFNIPDLRGIFPRGWNHAKPSTSGYYDPDASARSAQYANGATGDSVGSYQVDQFASHQHTTTGWNGIHEGDGTFTGYLGYPSLTNLSGFTGGSETRAKNASVMYLIRVQ